MPFRCIILDLDGVLCRYDLPRRLAWLAARAGRTPAEIEAAIWGSGFEDRADAGAFSAEEYLREFGARIGVALSRAEWVAARAAGMTLDDAMPALLGRLAGVVPLGLLTNNGWLLRETLAELAPRLPPLFGDRLFVSAEFGVRKPDPEVFRRLAARLGLSAPELLMVDDNGDNVRGALAAGWQGHHFQTRERFAAWLSEAGLLPARPLQPTGERDR